MSRAIFDNYQRDLAMGIQRYAVEVPKNQDFPIDFEAKRAAANAGGSGGTEEQQPEQWQQDKPVAVNQVEEEQELSGRDKSAWTDMLQNKGGNRQELTRQFQAQDSRKEAFDRYQASERTREQQPGNHRDKEELQKSETNQTRVENAVAGYEKEAQAMEFFAAMNYENDEISILAGHHLEVLDAAFSKFLKK